MPCWKKALFWGVAGEELSDEGRLQLEPFWREGWVGIENPEPLWGLG